PRNLLRADDAPHRSAGVGNDLGKFLGAGVTANDRKRTAAELFESDVMFHTNDLRRRTISSPARPRLQCAADAPGKNWNNGARPGPVQRGVRRYRHRTAAVIATDARTRMTIRMAWY